MALTKEKLLALFAAYPNNNQNTVREFVDYIFGIVPPGGFLPLSGGTMTGNINMNGTELLAAVLNGATKLKSAQSIQSEAAGVTFLNFGSTLNPGIQLLTNGGVEGFEAALAIGINNTRMFNAVGEMVIGNALAPAGERIHMKTTGLDIVHSAEININSLELGFFGVPAVTRQAAFTAPDNTSLAVELAAFPLTLAVINNIRTRVGETATGLTDFGLWN